MQNKAGGCITAPANIISQELRAVWDAVHTGADASQMQKQVTELRHILEKYSPFPPALKAILNRMYDFPRWAVKPPLEDLDGSVIEKVILELEPIAS